MVVRRRTSRILAGALIAGLFVGSGPYETVAAAALPANASSGFPTTLNVGNRGEHVVVLQRALIAAGVSLRGGADGIYGLATETAVRTFQTQRGLQVTGTANQATLRALGLLTAPGTPAEATQQAARGAAGAPAAAGAPLQQGARGAEVAALQRALLAAGITVPGGADGVFGNATRTAVTAFQRAQNLPATGIADVPTLGALGLTGTPTSAASGGSTVASLQVGARGDAVARLQQALINAGIPVRGGADGVFGLATQAAVRTFQTQRGLAASGVADQETLGALGLVAGAPAPTAPPTTTPPTASPAADGVLRVGARGDDVRLVQQALMQAGIHVHGGADGVFGTATQTAVRSFQAAQGLTATGEVDAATATALGIGGTAAPAPSPAPSPAPAPTPAPAGVVLRVGDRGPDVVRVQQALMDRSINVRGGADGVYGLATAGAVREFQLNRGLTQTGNVDQATWDALGLNATPVNTAPAPTLEIFPMQGPCYFGDTWGAVRSEGRRHEGVDIIGASGLAIYAVAHGTITRKYLDTPGSRTGNGVRLTVPDGTYYFYAHFSDFAPGIEIGSVVVPGQIIGYNGATGNAGIPHLHFEVHPGGGAAINPFPMVKAIDGCQRTDLLPQPG